MVIIMLWKKPDEGVPLISYYLKILPLQIESSNLKLTGNFTYIRHKKLHIKKVARFTGNLFMAFYFLSSSGTSGSKLTPIDAAPAPELAIASIKDAIAFQKSTMISPPLQ